MDILIIVWRTLKRIFSNERAVWIAVVSLMLIALLIGASKYNKLNNRYDNSVQNNKAYLAQLDDEKAKSNMFKVTIDQLEYYNDSIASKLLETKNELGIKDKEVKQLQYLVSEFNRVDTLYMTDTIFRDPDFKLDTIVGDKWVNTKLQLEYPNLVCLETEAVSEKAVVVYIKKETIDPPKKFFLCRWFQKKHTVVKVVVDEKNPHIKSQENVFFEIVK